MLVLKPSASSPRSIGPRIWRHKPLILQPNTQRQPLIQTSAGSRFAPEETVTPAQRDSRLEMKATSSFDRQAKMELVREDLFHVFGDRGIDTTQYEDALDFADPVTKYSNIQGFMFNIAMLKYAFDPKVILHDMRPEGECSIMTRWTMIMTLKAVRWVPVLGQLWRPRIIVSGTSLYVYRPSSGRIMRHIDTWDSISNQEFFSLEACNDFMSQLWVLRSIPERETERYIVLKRFKDYEVRQYDPCLFPESPSDHAALRMASAGDGDSNCTATVHGRNCNGHERPFKPASLVDKAFKAVTGYVMGRIQTGQQKPIMLPFFPTVNSSMQLAIEPSTAPDVPTPSAPIIGTKAHQHELNGIFAVRAFSGVATDEESQQEQAKLRTSVLRDGHQVASSAWSLACYNDPSTWAMFRRNEVLMPLKDFQLW